MYVIIDETDIFHTFEVGNYRTLDEVKSAYRELKKKNPGCSFEAYKIERSVESEDN